MSQLIDIKVPDIGDFTDVPVIEVFVKPGDIIKVDDALVTLESDKATMDVPASASGMVKEVLVKLGDKIGEGTVVVRIEATDSGTATPAGPPAAAPAPSPASAPAPTAPAVAGGLVDIKVPDIGDFSEVPVIEVFVKPGDVIKIDDALVTLESDKATMDVPASAAGTVKEVLVKLGDKIGEGTVVVRVEASDATAAAEAAAPATAAPPAATSTPVAQAIAPLPASNYTGTVDVECDLLVLGGGPGGYSAAFRAADLGLGTVIVERYGTLGGVCLHVGWLPDTEVLHLAGVMEEITHLHELGIVELTSAKVSVEKLREHKMKVVSKLTGGLAGMAKSRKVQQVRGLGQFIDAHHMSVDVTSGDGQKTTGEKKIVRFKQAIIAAGSQSIKLPFMPVDPRVVDSTGAR